MSEQASFSLQHLQQRAIVTAGGEIDLANVAELQVLLDRAEAAGTPVVLDLSRVQYCDSRTLNALARFETAVRKAGRRVALVMPAGGPAHKILQVAGLASRFERFDTLEAALAAA